MTSLDNTTENIDYEERLGPAHVGLRDDLEVHRHLFQGQVHYTFRDPLTLKCFQMTLKEYSILTYLTSKKSLSEILSTLIEQEVVCVDEKEDFFRFVMNLHQMNLLQLPISDDKVLYRRHMQHKIAKKKQQLMSIFFLQIPLFNPDVFLEKTCHIFKPLFTKAFFMVWLIAMVFAGLVITDKYNDLIVSAERLFALKNLPVLLVILILLKVIHEFGHAYACKIFGGDVTEMGAYLIVLTPCAYVDVTSSWGFIQKTRRLIVGLGGMYFESIIAMIALFTWVAAESVSIKIMAYNVFFTASVVTVLMNINPLMRFDGYYILSDLIEIPNLRDRSRLVIIQWLKRCVLGIKIENNTNGLVKNMIFIVFGLASSVYKITIVISISMLIAGKFFVIGLVLAGFYIGSTLLSTLMRLGWYLWKSPEISDLRLRAVVVSLFLVVAIPVAAMFVPLPQSIRTDVQLVKEYQHVIHARQDGFVEQMYCRDKDRLKPATAIIQLQNPALDENYLEAQIDLKKAIIELEAFQGSYDLDATEIKKQEELIKNLKEKLAHQALQKARLTIQSSHSGQLIESMEPGSIGKFVHKGDPIGTVVGGKWQVKALLAQSEISTLEPLPGKQAMVRLVDRPGHVLQGKIEKVSPAPISEVSMPVLTTIGQGSVPVDPVTHKPYQPFYEVTISFNEPLTGDFQYGITGKMKLQASSQPLGLTVWRKVLHFLNNLNVSPTG